mgnify:CR=1 FL=1
MYRWGSRSPQGGRGLKPESVATLKGPWRRSPQGGRGLKPPAKGGDEKTWSRSPQGGRGLKRVEEIQVLVLKKVALRKEGVD